MSAAPHDVMRAAKEGLITAHNAWFERNDPAELYRRHYQSRRIAQILALTEGVRGNLLDIGCFDGHVAELMLRQGGKTVYGMDRLAEALQRAEGRGIMPVLGDIDDARVPFDDGFFSCVVMGEVLDYVFDPDAVIAEVRRVLTPGGTLIITVPNLVGLANRVRVAFGRPPYCLDVRPKQGGYWRYFTFETLRELVVDHGFAVQSMQANVVALPFFLLPGLHRRFAGNRWERYRVFSSERLARWLPRLGENIVLAATRAG
jgi:SAM-dependent methyltransferase